MNLLPKASIRLVPVFVLLARAWCIDRQCERPVFQNHAECVKLREIRNSQGRVP